MAQYVDGFLVPVPKRKLDAYRRMSSKAGKIWRELGARRMHDTSARLVERVLPAASYRQWVLTFPLQLRIILSPDWLKIDPNFDPLRNNPRFQKLVAGGK